MEKEMTLSEILTGVRSDSPLEDDQENTEPSLHELMLELIDEVTLGLCFEVHRASKLGTVFLDDTQSGPRSPFHIRENYGHDVFGQAPMKKTIECVCPNCQRNLAASRFAPHLEKCMGMGRNSSRIASRRIANTGKKDSDNESDDDNNDNDWCSNERKTKKHKRDNRSTNSPRRSKSSKVKNGDIPSVGSVTSEGSGSNIPAYESMALEERKARLLQTCGVISEHNKKMCTRSHRCPQHSDEQRRAVRVYLLGQQGSLDPDDIHVDIDSYEDGDSQALRDTLQWEAASNPSPADSTSTNNSSSSRKKKKTKSQSKKKSQSKLASSGNVGTPSSLYEFV